MRIPIFTFALIGIAAFFTACGTDSQNSKEEQGKMNEHSGHNMNKSEKSENSAQAFRAEFNSQPEMINAGNSSKLIFKVKNQMGEIIRDLPLVHEKPMHVLIVSKDLAEFYHLHPELQEDGSYAVSHTFPNGGDYKIYADFTPKDSTQVVEEIPLKVAGPERATVPLEADTVYEKTVEGLKVVMKPSAEIKAGQELMLDFQAFDATTGKPATDLQNYLGELAHFVLISEDLKDFVHAHPMSKNAPMKDMKMSGNTNDHSGGNHNHSASEDTKAQPSASEVSAHTSFPRAGLYKVWAQFQRNNKVITVPFVVKVN